MCMLIYINSLNLKYIKELLCETVPTGVLGIGGNKGAIGVFMK